MARRKSIMEVRKEVSKVLKKRLMSEDQTITQNYLSVPQAKPNLQRSVLNVKESSKKIMKRTKRNMILNMSSSINKSLSNLYKLRKEDMRSSSRNEQHSMMSSLPKPRLHHKSWSTPLEILNLSVCKSRNSNILSRKSTSMSKKKPNLKLKIPQNTSFSKNGKYIVELAPLLLLWISINRLLLVSSNKVSNLYKHRWFGNDSLF